MDTMNMQVLMKMIVFEEYTQEELKVWMKWGHDVIIFKF